MFEEVLAFWFREIEPRQWWAVDPDFDALLRSRYLVGGYPHRNSIVGRVSSVDEIEFPRQPGSGF